MKCLGMLNHGKSIFFCKQQVVLPTGEKISMYSSSKMKRFLGGIRLFERLFRLEPRCAAFIGKKYLLLAYQRHLWIIDIDKGIIMKTMAVRSGFSDVLSFCQMNDAVYFGDYGNNPNNEPIHVYRLGSDLELRVAYTFPAGSIRHIHGLVYDKWRKRFFIFTGDDGKQVGIYTTSSDFTSVEPFLIGSQQYRTVIGYVTEKYLYYSTDAVMEENSLYRVSLNGEKSIQKICTLTGSVVFGCNLEHGFLISTTVEPYPIKKSALLSILDNRRGKGIKSADVMLWQVDEEGKMNLIKSYRKDLWPMRLFQYGCVQFPALMEKNIDSILVNPVAVEKYDGKPQEVVLSNDKRK